MKTIKKLLKIFFIIGWILIIVIGYSQTRFYKKYIHKPFEDGWVYLGEIGGKKIYGSYVHSDEEDANSFSIRVNDEILYVEFDNNKDGKADDIVYCENGRESYSTSYDPSTRDLLDRNVEYYGDNGQHEFTVFDKKGDGNFASRIKYLDKEPEVSFEEAKKYVEILVNNEWRKLEKENDSYGFYNNRGEFVPIDWNKGNWKLLEIKE